MNKLLKRFSNYQIEIDAILKDPCLGIKVPGQIDYLKEKNSKENTKKVLENFRINVPKV